KVMVFASHFLCQMQNVGQRKGFGRRRAYSVGVPSSRSVPPYLAFRHGFLERRKSRLQPAEEFLAAYLAQLRLRVVNVVDVQCLDADVPAAGVNLVFQVLGGDDMAAGNDLLHADDAGVQEFLLEIGRRVRRFFAIEGQETALGGQDDFVALDFAGGNQCCQRLGDGAFASLVSVIDGRIDDVDAHQHRLRDGLSVTRIVGGGGLAEVGADADGGNPETLRLANMPRQARRKSLAKARRTFRCSETWNQHEVRIRPKSLPFSNPELLKKQA